MRLVRAALLLLAGWALVTVIFVHAALPNGLLNIAAGRRGNAFAVAPEWFAFFTRNPEFKEASAFRRVSGHWVSAVSFPIGSSANYLGWNRKGRAQFVELDHIVARVPGDAWRTCARSRPVSCLEHAADTGVRVSLGVREPLFCGRIGMVRVAPVPWNLRSSGRGVAPAMDYAVVRVRC